MTEANNDVYVLVKVGQWHIYRYLPYSNYAMWLPSHISDMLDLIRTWWANSVFPTDTLSARKQNECVRSNANVSMPRASQWTHQEWRCVVGLTELPLRWKVLKLCLLILKLLYPPHLAQTLLSTLSEALANMTRKFCHCLQPLRRSMPIPSELGLCWL